MLNISEGNYQLIVSSIGYETVVYSFSADQLPLDLRIKMKQKSTELAVVTVEPSLKNGWRLWGKMFEDNFIGTIPNADQCNIVNRNALRFFFSKKKNRLTVHSDEPLIIENKALGYIIKYQLEEFYSDFNTHITLYLGYPFFQEMAGSKGKQMHWKTKRRNAYYGSILHFMRSLYSNQLNEQGFQVIRTAKVMNKEKQRVKELYRKSIAAADTFAIKNNKLVNIKQELAADSIRYYNSILNQPDSYVKQLSLSADSIVVVDEHEVRSIFFADKLVVIYNNNQLNKNGESEIHLATPAPMHLEKNGNYYPPQELFTIGYWAIIEKLANALPMDYQPDDK